MAGQLDNAIHDAPGASPTPPRRTHACPTACLGAAGSLISTGMTTPATPGNRTWTFRLRNQSDRPLSITLTIVWRRIASAGYGAR